MIDPKKIEQWRQLLEWEKEGRPSCGPRAPAWTMEVMAGLLAKQEEMLAERNRFACRLCRNAPKVEDRDWCVECEPCERIPIEEALAEARKVRDGMLVLLREIEWRGVEDERTPRTCPSCCGERGDGDHAPDCRLAAFLGSRDREEVR